MIIIDICLDLLSEKNLKESSYLATCFKDFKNTMQEIEITRWLFVFFSEYTDELYSTTKKNEKMTTIFKNIRADLGA